MKKCPICYSILPPKVIFCPICGTELQPQVSDNSEIPAAPAHHSFRNPTQRPVFRDEPVETAVSEKEEFTLDSQYAWKLTDTLIPLQMKGQINYSDSYQFSKINFGLFKKLNIFDFLIIGSLSFISAILLLFQVGLIGIMVFNLISNFWITLSILLVSLIFSSVISYILNQKTAVILERKKEIEIKIKKKNFLSFLPIQGFHIMIIGLIVSACYGVIRSISSSVNHIVALYSLSLILVIVISILSPPLRVSKILSLLRESSIMQNLHDASQFPKLSLKRSLELIGFTFLFPSLFIIASLDFVTKLLSGMFSPTIETTLSTWSIFLFVIMMILLSLNLAFTSLYDVRSFAYYEKLMQDSVEPPEILWVENQMTSRKARITNNDSEEDLFSNTVGREELCPTCSTLLIEGAEFCTDCGTKVTK